MAASIPMTTTITDTIVDESSSRHETAPRPEESLALLMTWLSPSYPVGAFSYSHGLEWAVETSDIGDASSLQAWLSALLRYGSGWTDAVLCAHAWSQVGAGTPLFDLLELGAALQPTQERLLEATAQGRAFLDISQAVWPTHELDDLSDRSILICYPVAVGAVAACHHVPLHLTLNAYLHAFIANLVSAGVRLVPLGQTDGQRVTAALLPEIHKIAQAASNAPLDDLGGAAFRSDIASMRHETQYTRLFRS